MAACGSYSRIEGFAFLPITCFSMALTTFIGQNLGAKKFDRAKAGAKFGIFCSVIMAEMIGVLIWILAPYCNGSAVLLPARIFSLYRGDLPRRGQSEYSHVHHAGLLVPRPYHLYFHSGSLYSEHRGNLLGISDYLGTQFRHFPVLLSAFRLGTCFRAEGGKRAKRT